MSRMDNSPLANGNGDTAIGEWVTASDEYAVFMGDRLRAREETARRDEILRKEEVTKREEIRLAEEAARQQETIKQQEVVRHQEVAPQNEIQQQQEALQRLETLRFQETALRQQKTGLQYSKYSQNPVIQPRAVSVVQQVVPQPKGLAREQCIPLAPSLEQCIHQQPDTRQEDEGTLQKPIKDTWQAWLAKR